MFNSELAFPFAVRTEGEHVYISVNLSSNAAIQIGSELLEVNGLPIARIKDDADRYFPWESYIDPYAFFLIFGSPAEYQVKVILPQLMIESHARTPSGLRPQNEQEWGQNP